MAIIKTNENALQYDHSLNHLIEFFSKAGSLLDNKTKYKRFYSNQENILDLFRNAWITDKLTSMKLLFWLRDCRGGAGNRSGFRLCLKWLAETDPNWLKSNLSLIPEFGRYDDLRALFGTELESAAIEIWANKIIALDYLACKWADRTDKPLLNFLIEKKAVKEINEFRRLLAKGRKGIVEQYMCGGNWQEIKYEHCPSVAMARYTNAFTRNDGERFKNFKTKAVKGETKINAEVLFPHDCIITANYGDKDIADAQFNALPDYIPKNKKIMCVCDTSASMTSSIAGNSSVKAIDISVALTLYCSDRMEKENPFYRKFLQFCSESRLTDWSNKKFSEVLFDGETFNGAVGSTRIDIALDTLLNYAKLFNATKEFMPDILLIISDMQFSEGAANCDNMTTINNCLKKWSENNYDIPKIIYWNLMGYTGSPELADNKNIALVSGFSPSILKAILKGEDFSPMTVMLRTLEKYNIIAPI